MTLRRLTVSAGLLVGLLFGWLLIGCGGSGPSSFAPPADDVSGRLVRGNFELSFTLGVGNTNIPGAPSVGEPSTLTATLTVDATSVYQLTSDWGTVVRTSRTQDVVRVTGTYTLNPGYPANANLGNGGTFDITFTIFQRSSVTVNGVVTPSGSLDGRGNDDKDKEKKFRIKGNGKGNPDRGYYLSGKCLGQIYDD